VSFGGPNGPIGLLFAHIPPTDVIPPVDVGQFVAPANGCNGCEGLSEPLFIVIAGGNRLPRVVVVAMVLRGLCVSLDAIDGSLVQTAGPRLSSDGNGTVRRPFAEAWSCQQ